jgi:signal transduction histidine kinase
MAVLPKPTRTRPARIVGVIYDITSRKILEQHKDEFIGIASHELKTPVTSIKAYGEILQEIFEAAGDKESFGLVKKLNTQIDRLTDLIRTLLDITRITDGLFRLVPEQLDLDALVAERVEDLQYISDKHAIVFTPGKTKPVTGDRERLILVMNNLITNAVKYSPDGGTVAIKTKNTKTGVNISVKDNGIGISEEQQQKIFNRFYRVDVTESQSFPGMGLGLYITAEIVRFHKGSITVISSPGEGAEFNVLIPFGEETAAKT